jgi:hypothetical protein
MKKIVLLAAMLAMSVMMMAPGAAMADDLDFDGFDDEEEFFFDYGDFFPYYLDVEIDDIDCDGSDDDGDGEIDEDIVCVVEFDIDYDGFDGDGDGFDEDFFDN